VHARPMFGAYGLALKTSVTFISQAAMHNPAIAKLGLQKTLIPVGGIRSLRKQDMHYNTYTPHIEVHPQNYKVHADGELLWCEPATSLPMAQRYFLF
jgi:urease subunit alpha